MRWMGLARKLDRLGRVVVPMEARKQLGWKEDEMVEIFLFGHYILLHGQSDTLPAPVEGQNPSPILQKVREQIDSLSDQDLLLVSELVERLKG